jgi:hypothetical protein
MIDSDWFRKDDDVRWQWREATWTTNGSPKVEHNQAHQYPSPQRGNWVQHFIHHLAPHGMAGFVLANGSMSSNQFGEGDIRRAHPAVRPEVIGAIQAALPNEPKILDTFHHICAPVFEQPEANRTLLSGQLRSINDNA